MAEWRGVPLRHVLELAGLAPDAVHVCPIGLDQSPDEPEVKCPMPLAKALDPDTLLALEMNGAPLPADHGFPVRCIVPGWVGTYSIKWVGRILVTKTRQWVYRNTVLYVLMGEEWPAERYHPAGGAPVTEQTIKSSLALPWPARLPAGTHAIRGYARSPAAPIREVVWSADGGRQWTPARLIPPNRKYAWVEFAFEWKATVGEHALMTRATDEAGRTQPDRVPFNVAGYLFNMVHPHPVVIE
jgi:DMSO/TMAO reductase YedYZ molybdopterin-dependent catalytic subunit